MTSKLDYCHALLYGLSDKILYKVQKAQNAAARVVIGTNKFEHITPVLNEWMSGTFIKRTICITLMCCTITVKIPNLKSRLCYT